MMRIPILLNIGLALCALCNAGSITYSGSFTNGTDTAYFTLTTDGATGALMGDDITGATLAIDSGQFVTLTHDADSSDLESVVSVIGNQLDFDFSNGNESERIYWFTPADELLFGFGEEETASNSVVAVQLSGTGLQGNMPIATATEAGSSTPEPSTFPMTFSGACVLVFAASNTQARKRVRQSSR